MTYRNELGNALKVIGELKKKKHLDPDVKHEPKCSYTDLFYPERDRYDDCYCTEELDQVEETLLKGVTMLDLLRLLDACVKSSSSVDTSTLESDLDVTHVVDTEGSKRLQRIKFVRRITGVDLQTAQIIEGKWGPKKFVTGKK